MDEQKDWIVVLSDDTKLRVHCVSFELKDTGALLFWSFGADSVCAFAPGQWRSVRAADAKVEG